MSSSHSVRARYGCWLLSTSRLHRRSASLKPQHPRPRQPCPDCPTHRRNSLASSAHGSGWRSRPPTRGVRMLLRLMRRSTPAQHGGWVDGWGVPPAQPAPRQTPPAQPTSPTRRHTLPHTRLRTRGLVLDHQAVARHNLRHGTRELVAQLGAVARLRHVRVPLPHLALLRRALCRAGAMEGRTGGERGRRAACASTTAACRAPGLGPAGPPGRAPSSRRRKEPVVIMLRPHSAVRASPALTSADARSVSGGAAPLAAGAGGGGNCTLPTSTPNCGRRRGGAEDGVFEAPGACMPAQSSSTSHPHSPIPCTTPATAPSHHPPGSRPPA